MNKTLAIVAVIGSLAAPALADRGRLLPVTKPSAAMADPIKSLPLGTGYGLSRRDRLAALPTETPKEIKLRPLTDAQVAQTLKVRGEEVNFCWDRLPPSQRIAGTAILHFQIEAEGKVTTVEVSGDAPSEAQSCIREAAEHWVFPRADVPTTIDHALRLR
jgi:hypothetical protein